MSYEQFVIEWIEKLKEMLHLPDFIVNIHYVKKVKPYKHISPSTSEGYTAEMESDPVYMEIDLYLSDIMRKRYEEGRKDIVVRDLLHELLHQITQPYYDFAYDRLPISQRTALLNVEENTVQKLTMILMPFIRI